jgi:ATP-dependent Clp protease ATP-binding subunit ClpC
MNIAGGSDERPRKFIVLAQEQASRLGHSLMGTEHLLLGIAQEENSVAARLFSRLEIRLPLLQLEVEQITGKGDSTSTEMVSTPRAKRVIELAFQAARELHHDFIGSEHILLGLIGEGEGIAAQILARKGVTRELVLAEMG